MNKQRKKVVALGLALICLGVTVGCGGKDLSGEEQVSTMREALMDLPYRVVLRDVETPPGARGVVTGRATDTKNGWTVRFAFILGAPKAKWLRKYVGDASGGVYNSNLDMQSAVNSPDGETGAERNQIADLSYDVEYAVCFALSGESCGI